MVNGLLLSSANDSPDRDPTSYQLYGSNSALDNTKFGTAGTIYDVGDNFTLISTGVLTPPSTRLTAYPPVSFTNTTPYTNYILVFPTVSNAATANSMQIAEADLLNGATVITAPGSPIGGGVLSTPEPGSGLVLLGGALGTLAFRRGVPVIVGRERNRAAASGRVPAGTCGCVRLRAARDSGRGGGNVTGEGWRPESQVDSGLSALFLLRVLIRPGPVTAPAPPAGRPGAVRIP